MLFYDFEVYAYDWLVVIFDMKCQKEHVIHNDWQYLKSVYEANVRDIWTGYNSRWYDQYILKCILLGMDPKELNDWIILKKRDGWEFSGEFRNIPLINYDVMPNPPIGLKTLEGFMGSDIRETDVPFDIDRPLTEEELQLVIKYCWHDVEETVKVFIQRKSEFEAMMGIVKAFNLPISCVGDTEARITAKVLDCQRTTYTDEFEYFFLPCIQLNKYKHVMYWFKYAVGRVDNEMCTSGYGGFDPTNDDDRKYFYKQSFETDVAGVPHTFGFGGLHGAIGRPVHMTGLILHVDVGSYYPSLLIAWDLVTRSARHPEQYKHVYDTRMALKRAGKKAEQQPYKKLLNALSGAMKDRKNPAYDPRNNNTMCICGQLMLLDLIEHLEAVQGFELIQSNTDGLIIRIPDTDEAFNQVDDICYEWESRCSTAKCSILLELDTISEIYQKDVNNYLWVEPSGKIVRKGAYVKELSAIDNDLPIVNKAVVEYMVHKTPVEDTVNGCTDLIMFQKLVKLSDKYDHVEHEHGGRIEHQSGKRVIKKWCEYTRTRAYTYKSYRVFASLDPDDGRILKVRSNGKKEKFGNTPDHCFINNDQMDGVTVTDRLDRRYYIDKAKERLKDFGVTV